MNTNYVFVVYGIDRAGDDRVLGVCSTEADADRFIKGQRLHSNYEEYRKQLHEVVSFNRNKD